MELDIQNQKNFKPKPHNNTILVVGIFFIIFSVLAIYASFNTYIDDKRTFNDRVKMFKDGVVTRAIVDRQYEIYSSDDFLGYSIEYSFTNKFTDSVETRKTEDYYSKKTLNKIVNNKKIEIVYLENGMSIETIQLSKEYALKSSKTMMVIALSLGGTFLALGAILVVMDLKKQRALSGKTPLEDEYVVTYTGYEDSELVSGVQYYRITFEYTDEEGNLQRDCTTQEFVLEQIKEFEKKGTFTIKTNGTVNLIKDKIENTGSQFEIDKSQYENEKSDYQDTNNTDSNDDKKDDVN